MSGVEVAREVREMGCPIFIAGCTGNALREDQVGFEVFMGDDMRLTVQEEYISAGADEIIPKPIHQKSVEEMIREARKRVRGETRPRETNDLDSP
jgi:CheY-like chemotaxis protein